MEMEKNSSGAFCPPLHNISRQSAAVCHYGHARLCVMTRGVRAGETFSKVSQPPFKTLKLRVFFETHGLKRYAAEKFRQPLQKQGVNVSVSAKHRPKLHIESRSDSMTPQSGVSFC